MGEFKDSQIEEPQVEVEGMVTNKEAIEFARKALLEISLESKTNGKFPGAEAYKKVMRAVILAGANSETIEHWQFVFEELEKEYKTAEDPEAFVEDLRLKLEKDLAEAEEAMSSLETV
ncbi:MAG: hypothetical protein WCV71_01580 [Patescibacteria group bacterium]|jgi:hypothetical protein